MWYNFLKEKVLMKKIGILSLKFILHFSVVFTLNYTWGTVNCLSASSLQRS